MNLHKIKIWRGEFSQVETGYKTAEFRKNDRDYRSGDLLLLQEYVPSEDRFTRDEVLVRVTHINYGPDFGIPNGYCMMSIKKI